MNSRSMSLHAIVLAGLVAVSASSAARAEAPEARHAASSARPRLELELGGYLGIATGNVCRRRASDLMGCTSGSASLGPLLGLRLRVADLISAGAFSSLSWGGDSGYGTLEWQLAAQARWLPLGFDKPKLWLGPDAGLVYVVDDVAANELGSRRSYATAAPLVGLGTGVGFPVASWFEVGISLRFFVRFFGAAMADLTRQPSRQTEAGGSLTVSFNVLK